MSETHKTMISLPWLAKLSTERQLSMARNTESAGYVASWVTPANVQRYAGCWQGSCMPDIRIILMS